MQGLFSRWRIGGIVVERRELKSSKNAEWRGHVIKVASLGMTLEVQCDADQYGKIGEGEHLLFEGTFNEQKGQSGVFLRLVLDKVSPIEQAMKPKGVAA